MNKFDRVFSILVLLQTKPLVKATELSVRFEVSPRTVYRDIRTLKNAGIPIIGDPGIGYSIMDGYRLPPVMFSEEEAAALLTAEKFMSRMTDKQTQMAYSNALIKIKSILRSSEKQALETLDHSIAISDGQSAKGTPYLQEVLRSLAGKRLIEMEYQKANGESSQRAIEPIGCYHHISNWYLIAYCRYKADYRTFKLKRVVRLRVLDEVFNTDHISLQEYIEQQDQSWRREHQFQEVEIAFVEEGIQFAEWRKYYFGFVSQFTRGEAVHMKFLNANLEMLARWLLQFGNHARVVAPQSLKDRMQALADELYHHYQKNE